MWKCSFLLNIEVLCSSSTNCVRYSNMGNGTKTYYTNKMQDFKSKIIRVTTRNSVIITLRAWLQKYKLSKEPIKTHTKGLFRINPNKSKRDTF